jgi:hypothetical protein
MYATKHQPEGALHSWNRAQILHARVRPSAVVAAQSALHRELDAVGLKRLALRAVLRLAMQLGGAARAIVIGMSRDPAFLLLPPQLQLGVVRALQQVGEGEELHEIARLAIDPSFGGLSLAVAEAIVRALADHPHTSLSCDLLQLIRRPYFRRLSERQALKLIAYAAGPRPSPSIAPLRRERLESFAAVRRADLISRENAVDFLAEPVVVWFLDASSVNGHAAIVFGPPRDPSSLSYGFRWVACRGMPVARAYSPDPVIAAGWRRDAAYAAEKVTLPRRIEPLLIAWIEQSYAIAGDRQNGVRPPPSPAGLYQAALDAAIQLAQGKVKIDRSIVRGDR